MNKRLLTYLLENL